MWRVGIIGAGGIAQGFDKPGDSRVLSMTHAFKCARGFAVSGFYDLDPCRAEEAERKWQVPTSPRDRAEWLDGGWDIVYIATPDAQHAADLRDILSYCPKAVLVEKPVATDSDEAIIMLEEARRLGIPVMVNYPRRWHSALSQVREAIRKGKIELPSLAVFVVSGGVVHNLPHTIDLFHTLWGGDWDVSFNSRQREITSLTFSRGAESFAAAIIDRSVQPGYIWEAHFYYAGGKLELSHSPEVLELSDFQPHPAYSSYQVLTPTLRAEMEEESLLCRGVVALAQMMANPNVAAIGLGREIESQRLVAQVLRHF